MHISYLIVVSTKAAILTVSTTTAQLQPALAWYPLICKYFGYPSEPGYLYIVWSCSLAIWSPTNQLWAKNNQQRLELAWGQLKLIYKYEITSLSKSHTQLVRLLLLEASRLKLSHSIPTMNHKVPIRVDGRFRLGDVLGSGSYGVLFTSWL